MAGRGGQPNRPSLDIQAFLGVPICPVRRCDLQLKGERDRQTWWRSRGQASVSSPDRNAFHPRKGKPVVRRGRKAMGLRRYSRPGMRRCRRSPSCRRDGQAKSPSVPERSARLRSAVALAIGPGTGPAGYIEACPALFPMARCSSLNSPVCHIQSSVISGNLCAVPGRIVRYRPIRFNTRSALHLNGCLEARRRVCEPAGSYPTPRRLADSLAGLGRLF